MGGINFDWELKKNHEMEGASPTPPLWRWGVLHIMCTYELTLSLFGVFVLFCSILYYFVLSIIFLQWDQGKAFYTLNCFCEPQCNAGSKEIQSLFDINVILIHIDI